MRLGHMSERGLQVLNNKDAYQVLNLTNSIFVSFASWVDNVE